MEPENTRLGKGENTYIQRHQFLGFMLDFRGFALEPRCLLKGFYGKSQLQGS